MTGTYLSNFMCLPTDRGLHILQLQLFTFSDTHACMAGIALPYYLTAYTIQTPVFSAKGTTMWLRSVWAHQGTYSVEAVDITILGRV